MFLHTLHYLHCRYTLSRYLDIYNYLLQPLLARHHAGVRLAPGGQAVEPAAHDGAWDWTGDCSGQVSPLQRGLAALRCLQPRPRAARAVLR